MKTYSPKKSEIVNDWYVVDAEGMVLGRLATEVARVLRGKHKPTFARHLDTGDHVIVLNASKVKMTANKLDDKVFHHHSGYPGGIKTRSARDLFDTQPEELVYKAVKGMLPKGSLGRSQALKLRVYAGSEHPHSAQNPKTLQIAK